MASRVRDGVPADWSPVVAMNPAGVAFQKRKAKPPFKSMSNTDYAGNFQDFLEQVSDDQPFCFWLGTSGTTSGL